MRRALLVLATLALLAGTTAGPAARTLPAASVDCTDYCAEQAASNCDRVGSWRCDLYIMGCLGGCHLRRF